MSPIDAMPTLKDKKASDLIVGLQHFSEITLRVASITVGTIALLGIPAYFLDRKLETWPWLFVSALIVAMPLSLYLVYRVMREYSQRNTFR